MNRTRRRKQRNRRKHELQNLIQASIRRMVDQARANGHTPMYVSTLSDDLGNLAVVLELREGSMREHVWPRSGPISPIVSPFAREAVANFAAALRENLAETASRPTRIRDADGVARELALMRDGYLYKRPD